PRGEDRVAPPQRRVTDAGGSARPAHGSGDRGPVRLPEGASRAKVMPGRRLAMARPAGMLMRVARRSPNPGSVMSDEHRPAEAPPAAAPIDPSLRYDVTPYASDGGCPAVGWML